MGRPIHFEIHASDPRALTEFYGSLFGWKFSQYGDFPYHLAATGDGPGIDGAIKQRVTPAPTGDAPSTGATIFVGVEDIDAAFSDALKLGAEEAGAKRPVPGVGWSAYLRDPDGNLFGLFQNDTEAK